MHIIVVRKMIVILGSGLVLFVWFLVRSWPDEELHITMCDVGQGDAFVVELGTAQVLVDTGRSVGKLEECLGAVMPFWDGKIEMVIISHRDSDHDGALEGLKKQYMVEKTVDGTGLEQGDAVGLGEAKMEVWYGGGGKTEENEDSLVMRLVFGDFTMLFTGDMGSEEELAVMRGRVITPVTVVKVAHHGSKYSSSREWVEALRPRLALVSVGDNNSYGHPNEEVLRYFEMVGAIIKRTDRDGRVEVVTDGKTWRVQ